MMKILKARVLNNRALTGGYSRILLHVPGFSGDAAPGQFVMVRVTRAQDPLLPRPFSLLDAGDGEVELLVKAVGFGSRLLTDLADGVELPLLGPLGSAFPEAPRALLVAGGYGMAPLYFYTRRLAERSGIHLFYGARTDGDLLLKDDWNRLLSPAQIHYASEDGSRGTRGLVTAPLEEFLRKDPKGWTLMACGPMPMLKAVHQLAERFALPCHVSVDEPMACGYGVCLGCVVPTLNGYKRSCQDGPVFDSRELRWEAL
jgi:dihydroorotate dehydrogenase electron transfer subunit